MSYGLVYLVGWGGRREVPPFLLKRFIPRNTITMQESSLRHQDHTQILNDVYLRISERNISIQVLIGKCASVIRLIG